ncbi:CLUMA_CG012317, isoform A [Clunio marinus]|uniref:CLUMA_CG012317, isoform A n=1 Tax=Clunio marinus TaxID=568069 RepID=A0A1J1IG76_9DIPT|nr:CLUMA_CG012317, isoform A [Clunio marinus]
MKFGIEKLKTIEIHSTATSRPGYFEACSCLSSILFMTRLEIHIKWLEILILFIIVVNILNGNEISGT